MKVGTLKNRPTSSKRALFLPKCDKSLTAGSPSSNLKSYRSSDRDAGLLRCPYGLATCSGCIGKSSPDKNSLHGTLFDNSTYSSLRKARRFTSDLHELAQLAHETSSLLAQTDAIVQENVDRPKVILVELIGTLQGFINSLQRWQLCRYFDQPYALPYGTEKSSGLNNSGQEAALAVQGPPCDRARNYSSPGIALQHVFLELLFLLLREAVYDIACEASDLLLHEDLMDGETQIEFFMRSAEESADGLFQSMPYLRQLEAREDLIPTGCVRLLVCMSLSLAMSWYTKTGNVKDAAICAEAVSEIPDGYLYASTMAGSRASACESLANWIKTAW